MILPVTESRNAVEVDAFERALCAHERTVLRLAMRLTGNLEDAQDVAQEVFLKLHRELPRFQDESKIAAWLYRVTVNACFDERRRRKRARLTAIGEESSRLRSASPTPEEAALSRQDIEFLEAGMQSLSDRERAVLALRELQGLSTAEVARILGSTESTVRVQISAARIKLRKFFESVRGKKV